MERTYKFRIYPNVVQMANLTNTLTLCRKLYNAGLEERIQAHKAGQPTNYYKQKRELVEVKKELPEYSGVYSHALQDVMARLDKAYKGFFRRVSNGEKAGFPRYKSEKRFRSITYDRYGFRILSNGHLNLTKVGTIRMFKHRDVEGIPKTCIVKKDGVGDWWAMITVAKPSVPKVKPKTAIGVDVGLRNLMALTTGEMIGRPKLLSQSEDKIKIIQREASRKERGSNNRRKCVRRLAQAHRRVERQRDDFLHKASRKLSQNADVIVFEDLDIQNMQKTHHLAKSISDASWGKLMQYTAYKAEEAGRCVCFVNPNGTSQICSRCGEIVQKSLSERLHVCHKCGFSVDRDYNASLNILGRLRRDTVELHKTPVEALPLPLQVGGGKWCLGSRKPTPFTGGRMSQRVFIVG